MHVQLTIKNYRCFPDAKPARLTLSSGFTAIVGPNNSGKSSLLRFFYEFRGLFSGLAGLSGNLHDVIRGNQGGFNYSPSIADPSEVFCDTNDREVLIEFRFAGLRPTEEAVPLPSHVEVRIPRPGNNYIASVFTASGKILQNHETQLSGTTIIAPGNQRLDLAPLMEAAKHLSNALYIGPFRNMINIGTRADYFDIQVGQAFVQSWRNYKTGAQRREISQPSK